MKRNLMYVAVLAAAIMVSCNGKNTAQSEANTDSTSVADTTASENLDLPLPAHTRALCLQPTARASRPCSLSMPTAHTSSSRTT